MGPFALVERGITNARVLAAMEKVPRARFVPEEYALQADGDYPLPIGYGQTISQPYMVAVMTELLEPEPDDVFLEIGAGSGYHAAILAELVAEVYTIEIVAPLAEAARQRLSSLGYENVHVIVGDGYLGYPPKAPYDGILVTCAAPRIPPPLVEQLRDGARLVVPVGPPGGYQELWLVERSGDKTRSRRLMGVAFVPLTGPHGCQDEID